MLREPPLPRVGCLVSLLVCGVSVAVMGLLYAALGGEWVALAAIPIVLQVFVLMRRRRVNLARAVIRRDRRRWRDATNWTIASARRRFRHRNGRAYATFAKKSLQRGMAVLLYGVTWPAEGAASTTPIDASPAVADDPAEAIQLDESIDLVSGPRRYPNPQKVYRRDILNALLAANFFAAAINVVWRAAYPMSIFVTFPLALAAMWLFRRHRLGRWEALLPLQLRSVVVTPGRVEFTSYGRTVEFRRADSVIVLQPSWSRESYKLATRVPAERRPIMIWFVRQDGVARFFGVDGERNPSIEDVILRWIAEPNTPARAALKDAITGGRAASATVERPLSATERGQE